MSSEVKWNAGISTDVGLGSKIVPTEYGPKR
jgi:hypothetical protein